MQPRLRYLSPFWVMTVWVNSAKRVAAITVVLLIIGLASVALAPISWIYPAHTVERTPVITYKGSLGKKGAWIGFAVRFDFTADNTFSVNNPITVTMRFYNITFGPNDESNDFLAYIYYAGFTSAYLPNNNTILQTGVTAYPMFPLQTNSIQPQTYLAQGQIIYQDSGPSWLILYSKAFNPNREVANTTVWKNNPIAITITPLSDTLTWQQGESSARATWYGIVVCLIFAYDLLEAWFLRKSEGQPNHPRTDQAQSTQALGNKTAKPA